MINNQLTKDAERLLVLMYRAYLQSRKEGRDKLSAKQMGSLSQIHKELLPQKNPLDVLETCRELGRAGCLRSFWADNTILRAQLSDEAIIYMENRFKNGLKDIIAFLSPFVP